MASVEVMEFHATEAYSNFGLTNVQYSIRRLCREESLKYLLLAQVINKMATIRM
jgi:hypothetical protein